MAGKHLTELIDIERDIAPYGVTVIYAGIGAGKNSIVEGYHDDKTNYEGLAEKYTVLMITSRSAKVKETKARNDNFICDVRHIEDVQWDEYGDKSVICTYAHIQKRMEQDYIPGDSKTHFWNHFDYIVIDECHAIVTDSTFADSAFAVKCFIEEVYKSCIKGCEIDEITTKLVLMSATPEPIESFFNASEFHVLDCRNDSVYVKPENLLFYYYVSARNKLSRTLKAGQTAVYFLCTFDKMKDLIACAKEAGLKDSEIAVSVSSKGKNKLLKDEYEDIYNNKATLEKYLSENEVISDDIKLVITNSKNKEGINIKSEVGCVFIESHNLTDIKQMAGRVRNGVDKVVIVTDARQFVIPTHYTKEEQFQREYGLAAVNAYWDKLVEEIGADLQEENAYDFPALVAFIEYAEERSNYIRFNLFERKFEINECFALARQFHYSQIAAMKQYIDDLDYPPNKRRMPPALQEYSQTMKVRNSTPLSLKEYIKIYFAVKGYTFGETIFEKESYSVILHDLTAAANFWEGGHKQYHELATLLKRFGCEYKKRGKNGSGKFSIIKNF